MSLFQTSFSFAYVPSLYDLLRICKTYNDMKCCLACISNYWIILKFLVKDLNRRISLWSRHMFVPRSLVCASPFACGMSCYTVDYKNVASELTWYDCLVSLRNDWLKFKYANIWPVYVGGIPCQYRHRDMELGFWNFLDFVSSTRLRLSNWSHWYTWSYFDICIILPITSGWIWRNPHEIICT